VTAQTPVVECTTGRCGYGEPCRCDHYADWPKEKPKRTTSCVRHPGRFYRDGHRDGRSDACRRLWSHLDIEGRVLAKTIATEGACT